MCFTLVKNQTIQNCYYLFKGKRLLSTWYIALRTANPQAYKSSNRSAVTFQHYTQLDKPITGLTTIFTAFYNKNDKTNSIISGENI